MIAKFEIRVDARIAEDEDRAREFEKLIQWIWNTRPDLRQKWGNMIRDEMKSILEKELMGETP